MDALEQQRQQRAAARQREQLTYQSAAIAATTGVTATAIFATYYRCVQLGTHSLSADGTRGMYQSYPQAGAGSASTSLRCRSCLEGKQR